MNVYRYSETFLSVILLLSLKPVFLKEVRVLSVISIMTK